MRRRDFITLLGSAAVASPLLARPQQDGPGMPLVAVLTPGIAELTEDRIAALRRGLRDAGLIEDTNYALALRYANGDFERLPPLCQGVGCAEAAGFRHSGQRRTNGSYTVS
jgi:putative tryptophan/tyrosine transport system substrate-binding protein